MALSQSSSLATILSKEEEKLLACVHCGLCLEACPTYVITGDENDSPRGRIYLMRAVKEKRLAVDSLTFETHIDRCLGCRACESACPAGVEYGHLLEAARAEIARGQTRPTGLYRLLYFALKHVWLKPKRLRAAFTFARLLRESGVPRFLIRAGVARGMSPQFEFALALLDGSSSARDQKPAAKMPAHSPNAAPADRKTSAGDHGNAGAPVFLFKGCVTEGLFKRINEATMRVLEVNECDPTAPDAQVCCGALHAHAGDLEGARELARLNIDAFAEGDASIISNAGGCGAMLVSYAHLLADDEAYAQKAKDFTSRVRDIGQHLEANGFRNGANIGSARTTYDASCHLLHGQHGAESSLKMMWAIPDLNFSSLKDSDVCCGGAGVYNLMEPDLSDEVLAAKLDHIKQSGAEVVATGNPGCHMQIAAGARLDGMQLRVCHPVELLDESYRRAGYYE